MQARICGGLGWATTQVYPARAARPRAARPRAARPRAARKRFRADGSSSIGSFDQRSETAEALMRTAHCGIGPTRSRGNIARTETASSRSRPALISITPSRPGVLSQLDSPVRVTDRHAPRPPNVSRPSVSDLDDLIRSGRARHLPGAWSPVAISGCIKTTPAARQQQRCSRPNGRPRRSLSPWPPMTRPYLQAPRLARPGPSADRSGANSVGFGSHILF